MSSDCQAASRDTNLPSSPFECRITIVKYCDRFQPAWKWDQILLIDVYPQIVACKLKNLSDFTPDINFSSSEAGRRRLWSLVNLDQFGRVKKSLSCFTELIKNLVVFRKIIVFIREIIPSLNTKLSPNSSPETQLYSICLWELDP